MSVEYQNKWEARSSVRTRPKKIIDFTLEGYFFPEEKQPLLISPEIKILGEDIKAKILLETFYKYLFDIVNLEAHFINKACYNIIDGDLPIKYSDTIKLDAYTIIIDELYHIYMAKDMMLQLESHFQHIGSFKYPGSDAYSAVEHIKRKLPEEYHAIFEVIAVCIFETTLVKELVEFFDSEHVHPSIKYYVNDHMNDESRHYGYFRELLEFTWSNLTNTIKDEIAQYFPEFIKLYLNVKSEMAFNKHLLCSILNDDIKSEQIVSKLYKGFDITPEVPIVKNVINVLRNTKILDYIQIQIAFEKAGWGINTYKERNDEKYAVP